jgi:PKD repeat protein
MFRRVGLLVVTTFLVGAPIRAADSPWLYGIHWYGDPASNLVEVMTGGKPIWSLETAVLYDGYWNVSNQLPKFQTLVARGHTLVTRIQPRWGLVVPAEADMTQYLQDVTTAAHQLADLTHIWQIGNEMNLPWEYNIGTLTPAEYVSRFKRIRNAIKAIPSSLGPQIVLLGPVAPVDNAWLGAMLDHLAPGDFDGFALHAYGVGDAASSRVNFRNQYAEQLHYIDTRGYAAKPVYLLEWGRQVSPISDTNEAASAQFLHGALQDLHAWNTTPGNHPIVCACWFIYANDTVWQNWSILGLKGLHPAGHNNDLYDAFQYACTLNLPAGGGSAPQGPVISRSPATLNPTAAPGQNAAGQTFAVSNGGTGTLNYTIAENIPWLWLTPTEGTSNGEVDTIAVHYTTASLAAGSYSGTITLSDPAAGNSPQAITVHLSIQTAVPPPAIVNPDFQANGGGWNGAAAGWATFGGNKWEGVFDNSRSWTQGVSELSAGGACGVRQIITTTNGAQYRVAVYGISQHAGLDVSIGVDPAGGTNPSNATFGTPSTSTNWTQVSCDFTATGNSATLFLRGRNTSSGFISGKWCLFDGVSIEVLAAPGNHPPAAVAAGSPLSGSAPLTVNFTASGSSDPDPGQTLSFAWDFGDGGAATGSAVTHTYTSPGNYTATLTVSDGHGGIDTDTLSITVTTGGGPGGENLIANPGFESTFSAGLAAGWQSWQTSGTGYWKQSARLGRIGAGIYSGTNGFNQTVRLNPKTVLLSDLALGHAAGLRAALPDALIIGRLFIDPFMHTGAGGYLSNPEFYGAKHADDCYSTSLQKPGISAWQGFNEPVLNDEDFARRVGRFEKAFADRCHERGLKACVLNLAVGNPGDMSRMLLPEIVAALGAADYAGYHTYGGIDDQLMMGPQRPWFALRWRFYMDLYAQAGHRMPPVVYTECTTYYAWRGIFTAQQIRDDLTGFEALTKQADPWSVGMCIFLVGSNSAQWDGWEVADQPVIYEGCGDYNLAHPADAWAGLHSQQFGETSGGFTGGVRQVVAVTAGRSYRLDHWMKHETYGVNNALAYHVGYDYTGQTSNPNAPSLTWTGNLLANPRRETDWWYRHTLEFTATGPQVSIWFKGTQPSGRSPWRIMLDEVALTRTSTPPAVFIGDFDGDGDVDQSDFGHLQACLSGAGQPQADPACAAARLDADPDVDSDDFGLFQQCHGAPNQEPPPECRR